MDPGVLLLACVPAPPAPAPGEAAPDANAEISALLQTFGSVSSVSLLSMAVVLDGANGAIKSKNGDQRNGRSGGAASSSGTMTVTLPGVMQYAVPDGFSMVKRPTSWQRRKQFSAAANWTSDLLVSKSQAWYFVVSEFDDASDAEAACDNLDGALYFGQELVVDWCRRPHRRSAGNQSAVEEDAEETA